MLLKEESATDGIKMGVLGEGDSESELEIQRSDHINTPLKTEKFSF